MLNPGMNGPVRHASIPGNIAVVAPIRLKGATPPIGFAAPFARGQQTWQWHRSLARSLGHKSNKDETVAKLISFIK